MYVGATMRSSLIWIAWHLCLALCADYEQFTVLSFRACACQPMAMIILGTVTVAVPAGQQNLLYGSHQ
jgi:hypothetical protein